MKVPFLLLLDGMTGAGKSTTSGLLAKQIPRLATIGIDNVKLLISDYERGDRDNNIAHQIIFFMTRIYFDNNISVIVDQPIKTQRFNCMRIWLKIFQYQFIKSNCSHPRKLHLKG